MGRAAPFASMTADEFIAWDAGQTQRHEFVRGEVFAMAGAGEAHVTVAGNVYVALRAHLSGTPCRTFIADMKLRVDAVDAYYYPDVMVTCAADDAADAMVKREPVLLIEVLSPGTAAYDRGDKFAAYRRIASLREVALIDPDSRRCDVYRRGDEGLWVLHPSERDEALHLASVALTVGNAALWHEVPEAASPGSPSADRPAH